MARSQKANGTKPKPSITKVEKLAADNDVTMGTAPAPLADAQDDPMADPEDSIEAANGEEGENSEMDEAADLEMMDRLNAEGAFDSEGDEDGEEEEDDEDEDEDEDEDDGGAPLSPSANPLISADAAVDVAATEPSLAALLYPHRPTPYTHDAGHLLVVDPNPLPPDSATTEPALAAAARDATQSLLNHLLTTCPVRASASGISMTLPRATTALPREKRIPTPKAPTKWEAFAAKKGIGKFAKGSMAQQDKEGRAGKMVFDATSGEWVPKYGYKGKNKAGEDDWLVEIDSKKAKDADGMDVDPRSAKRAERKERVRRNERAQRANERRGRQGPA